MSRKRKNNKKKASAPTLYCLNPNAAGVDVGATEIYIAVPVDRDPQPVRHFSTFTEDLHAAADWLKDLQHRDGGDGIDGSLLDSVFSDSGGARIPSLSGQRTSRAECAGTQIGRFRLSVAAISTFGRITVRVVPAGADGLHGAFDPSSSGQPSADGFEPRPTHAKGFGSDEPATAPRDQRYHRCDRNDDHEGHLGG